MQSLEDEAVTASIPSLSTSRTSPAAAAAAAATTANVFTTEDAGKPDAGHKAEPGMLSRTYRMQPASCLPKQIIWPKSCYVSLLSDAREFEPGLPNSCNIISSNVSALSVLHQLWVVCLLHLSVTLAASQDCSHVCTHLCGQTLQLGLPYKLGSGATSTPL